MKSSTYLRIVTAWWIAAIALIAFGALAKAQTPAGVINAPIYATGYISQVGGINVTTKIPMQPNHPTNLNIFTTEAISGTWTIKLPNPAFEGQILTFNCSATVNAIIIQSTDGSAVDSTFPSACGAAGGFAAQFDQRSNIWRQLGANNTTNLAAPTLTSRGGVFAINPVPSQWLKSLGTDGTFVPSQPSFSDLSPGTVSSSNTWAAPQFFSGSGITTPFALTVSLSGNSTGTFGWNGTALSVSADDLNVGGTNFVNGLSMRHTFGGAAATGGRQAVFGYLYQSSITNASNANRNYVGGSFRVQTASGDGGTSPASLGTAKGAYFGVGIEALADAGATNLTELTGGEVNTVALAGSSIYYKTIWSLVGASTDAVRGSIYDMMLSLSTQSGAIQWTDGIGISAANGQFPIASTGNVFHVFGGSVARGLYFQNTTFANDAIDLSTATIAGNAFSSPGAYIRGDGALFSSANSAVVPAQTSGFGVTYNFSGGAAETVFWNLATYATASFSWKQKTGSGTEVGLMLLDPSGNLTTGGGITSTLPSSAGAGGLYVCADSTGKFYRKASCP